MVRCHDGDALVAGEGQETHLVDKLARIVAATMVGEDKRNGTLGRRIVENFVGQVLEPCVEKLALGALH